MRADAALHDDTSWSPAQTASAQRRRGRCGDLHRHYSTGLDGAGDVDRDVLARAAAVAARRPGWRPPRGPRRARPTHACGGEASACSCVSAIRRSTRSRWTSGGTWSGQVRGGRAGARREHERERRVEGRLPHEVERLRRSRPPSRPGKPAMRSVVMLTSGTAARSARDALEVLRGRVAAAHGARARGRSRPAPAGARARTRCGSSATAATRSSPRSLGCDVMKRTRSRPSGPRRGRAAAPAKLGAPASPPRRRSRP